MVVYYPFILRRILPHLKMKRYGYNKNLSVGETIVSDKSESDNIAAKISFMRRLISNANKAMSENGELTRKHFENLITSFRANTFNIANNNSDNEGDKNRLGQIINLLNTETKELLDLAVTCKIASKKLTSMPGLK